MVVDTAAVRMFGFGAVAASNIVATDAADCAHDPQQRALSPCRFKIIRHENSIADKSFAVHTC